MVQVINVCGKCKKQIKHGEEKYLQLIDRNETTATLLNHGHMLSVAPKVLWEYCLCPKCFEKFNKEMTYPYKNIEGKKEPQEDFERCWKCGKALDDKNRSNLVYTSNPPKYSCKDCDPL